MHAYIHTYIYTMQLCGFPLDFFYLDVYGQETVNPHSKK